MIRPPAKLLLMYVAEADTFGTTPLYEAILRRLRQLGVSGATAQAGMMGFGSHRHIHQKHLFGISDDRPVAITAVDNEHKLREALAEIRPMIQEGLVVLLDAEVVE